MRTRAVLWCAREGCATQIVGYGFAAATNPPTSIAGPWLCLFCAAYAARQRPSDITQAFTTEPVKPGSVWTFPHSEAAGPVVVEEDEAARLMAGSVTPSSAELARRLTDVFGPYGSTGRKERNR